MPSGDAVIHLATVPVDGGLKISWLAEENNRRSQPVLEMEFSRTVLGIHLQEGECFACVVGERLLSERLDLEPARYWIVLDEAHSALLQELIGGLIRLKDQYRCHALYSVDQPLQLVESLRRTEGISYYREERPAVARALWPSFVSFDVRAGLNARPAPDENTLHRELEMWLKWEVRWPSSGQPVLGIDGQSVLQVQFPHDFTTAYTRAGIRQASLGPSTALWLALSGLERSRANSGHKKAGHEWIKDPLSGY